MLIRVLIFLLLNFAALGLGSLFTNPGVSSDWYAGLHKAPWTPPGWMFGLAWTTIMVCFAIYMAYLWKMPVDRSQLFWLFTIQWVLNVAWNPVFFHFHQPLPALAIILALTSVTLYFLFHYHAQLKAISLLILPYAIWLLIASSLNAYIVFKN